LVWPRPAEDWTAIRVLPAGDRDQSEEPADRPTDESLENMVGGGLESKSHGDPNHRDDQWRDSVHGTTRPVFLKYFHPAASQNMVSHGVSSWRLFWERDAMCKVERR